MTLLWSGWLRMVGFEGLLSYDICRSIEVYVNPTLNRKLRASWQIEPVNHQLIKI